MQSAAPMRWMIALTTALSAVLLAVDPVRAANQCQVQSIELKDAGTASAWLSIVTDRPANFTSFKLNRPPRIVVDFPETLAQPRKTEAPSNGVVSTWSIERLGEGDRVVSRLTVELREDADYTLTGTGTGLELRFLPVSGRPITAIEQETVPAPAPMDAATAKDSGTQAATEKAERQRFEAEEREQQRKRAEAEKASKKAEAQALRDEEARKKREARELAKAEKARMRAEAQERRERIRREREAEREARAADKRAKEEARRATGASPVATLEKMAFRRTESGAELTVKLSAAVPHTLREVGAGVLSLELEQTKIVLPNNRRELDTRFFGAAVTRIIPKEVRGNRQVRIELHLSSAVPYDVSVDGSTLTVHFGQLPSSEMPRGSVVAVP